ncbi:MAG: hypothetical protein A2Z29_01755 [Chloroflexi bacterium RBG_16_56_11]|nr:MAG: hypothetical protein A2Z29_01755 [Chloroflexi bacterium RBG_16_56_11]
MAHILKKDAFLRPGEVARLLNIHINTVRRWSSSGIIKTYRIGPRGDRRFMREDVVGFLKER